MRSECLSHRWQFKEMQEYERLCKPKARLYDIPCVDIIYFLLKNSVFYIKRITSQPIAAMTKRNGKGSSLKRRQRNPVPRPTCLFRYSPCQRDLKDIIYHEKGTPVLELHRMTSQEARGWCLYFIEQFLGYTVQFIVGKGLHSTKGPVLKPMVKKMLRDHNYAYGEVARNPGRIYAILYSR